MVWTVAPGVVAFLGGLERVLYEDSQPLKECVCGQGKGWDWAGWLGARGAGKWRGMSGFHGIHKAFAVSAVWSNLSL